MGKLDQAKMKNRRTIERKKRKKKKTSPKSHQIIKDDKL